MKEVQNHFDNVVFTDTDELIKIKVEENVPIRLNPYYNNACFKIVPDAINTLPAVQHVSTGVTYTNPQKI